MRIKVGLLFTAVAAASLLASGCQFYFGGHGDDDDGPCVTSEAPVPLQQARNPYTGECVTGGDYGGGCYGYPTPDTAPGAGDAVAPWFDARWPVCENQCNSLSEAQCVLADGCRAIYVETNGCPPGTQCGGLPSQQVFSTCWATTSDGPIRGGDCTAITDAFECARHDDCAALHGANGGCGGNDCASTIPSQFISCLPEPSVDTGVCWSDTDCDMGETCDRINFCESDPSCTPGAACPPVCWGKCVPVVTPPPPPPPPASCSGLDEDTCIDMADGCIDTGSQPSCGMIKCEPIYAGSNCDCTPAGCTCQSWTYETCQSAS
jgi:hypothetical protein